MERTDQERLAEGEQLNRNRSFKSKQLVRSQAIRESQSPPRILSPSPEATQNVNVKNNVNVNNNGNIDNGANDSVVSVNEASECNDECDKDSCDEKKLPVEIQITHGSGVWERESSEQRWRTRRWLAHAHADLLTHAPRVACVCGACPACPHCRGRRRRHICTIKQDSGIACSEDCPDCGDPENIGTEAPRKADSVEVDEQIYYCRCPERKDKPKNLSLSRTDSEERMEPSGADLMNFIKETLNKNARDRVTLLKIEKELHSLVNDTGRCVVRFPVMTSYGRMLVHRCASLFQLSHHLDQNNKTAVIVSKIGTSGGRIPCTSFKQWCTVTFPPSPLRNAPDTTLAKSILKRDTNSLDEPGNGSLANSRSKSLEQREKDYERMKRRIFSTDNCSQDESQWPWLNAGPVKLLTPDPGRNKLVKVQSLEGPSPVAGRRGPVSKSHSFGGYAAGAAPRLLSRHGDLASSSWRLSPSSSGYKTLSLRSTDSVTPSPTAYIRPTAGHRPSSRRNTRNGRNNERDQRRNVPSEARRSSRSQSFWSPTHGLTMAKLGGASPEPSQACPSLGNTVVCAVTDMSAVPIGALVIDPQTGRPLTNSDGSLYHFDPANPPILYDPGVCEEAKIDQNNTEKKRGKLEKQHSFIDHECDCPPTEELRSKCCCEYSPHDTSQRNSEKNPQEKPKIPSSPTKPRYEQPATVELQQRPYEPTNQKALNTRQYEMTNQRPHTTNDRHYENYERFDANQREYDSQKQFEPANQTPVNDVRVAKVTNQDGQEVYVQQYGQGVRNDDVTSPQSLSHSYPPQDMNAQAMAQAKTTPVPMPDPQLRPVSLTNMGYSSQIPQGYTFVNQYRMEGPGGVFLQGAGPTQRAGLERPNDTGFRIDPSYPYAAVDFAAQCGACVDPNTMRSYNMPYGQVEMPQVMPYQMPNLVLPPHIQHCPYQEAVQWPTPQMMSLPPPKLMVPELYPMYPNMYQYNLLYPQMVPPAYPVCQPLYPAGDKPPSRAGSASSLLANTRDEHTTTHTDHIATRRDSTEIAVKIQQIKEQMSQLNTRDRGSKRTEEWRRRNNGSGILGSYPAMNGRVDRVPPRPINDETQLSSAARAIVNSIRNMQAKHNNNYQDRREYLPRNERGDYRRRQERDGDRSERDKDTRRNNMVQYRPPYLLRQLSEMTPGTWCRRSPGPVHPVLNQPRRPHPDTRNGRR